MPPNARWGQGPPVQKRSGAGALRSRPAIASSILSHPPGPLSPTSVTGTGSQLPPAPLPSTGRHNPGPIGLHGVAGAGQNGEAALRQEGAEVAKNLREE